MKQLVPCFTLLKKRSVKILLAKKSLTDCCSMEFIKRLLYPVWTFARSTIESILGKRGRDEIVDHHEDLILSPDIFDII